MKVWMDRVLGALTLASVAGALLAGGALAANLPDDRGGVIAVGQAAVVAPAPTGVFERAVERHVAETLFDPFDQAGTGPVRPDDRAGMRGAGGLDTPSPSIRMTEVGHGIAWDDAAFGAAVSVVLFLIVGVLTVLMIRQRARTVAR